MTTRCPQVLVVEDVMIAQKIAAIILGQFGCAVATANNGATALEAIEKQEFDFILMDLGLPDTDGITLTKTMREKGGWLMDVPIVAMTAHTDESFKGAAISAGITDFYIKPMTTAVAKKILFSHVFNRLPEPLTMPLAAMERPVASPLSGDDSLAGA